MSKLKLTPQTPIALALSGGGSKGAFLAGIVKYLYLTRKFRNIKVVYGTSSGALITSALAASMATQDDSYIEKMVKLYETVTDKDIITPNHDVAYKVGGIFGVIVASYMFGGNSVFSTKPLQDIVDKFKPPVVWDKIIASKDKFDAGFCITNVQTAASEIVSNINTPDRDTLKRALFASVNQPVFMEPIKVFANKPYQFVDGGVLDYNPIEKIFESPKITEVEAIVALSTNNTHDAGLDEKVHTRIDSLFLRTLSLFSESVYDSDIKNAQFYNVLLYLKKMLPNTWEQIVAGMPEHITAMAAKLNSKTYVPIYDFKPIKPVVMQSLKFEQPAMKNLVQQGFDEAKEMFG